MKDNETLAHHKLCDGLTVHLVIKSSPSGPQEPTSTSASSGAPPPPASDPSELLNTKLC